MRMLTLFATTATLALAACGPEAEDPATQDMAQPADTLASPAGDAAMTPTTAAEYVAAAGAGDLYEIQSSEIALQKAESDAVREFAQMMIDDHNGTTEQVTSAASAAGITVPAPALMPMQQQMLDQLGPLEGEEFDRAYIDQQRQAHQMALDLHNTYATGGDNPELQEVARAAVPIIQQHLDQLQGM